PSPQASTTYPSASRRVRTCACRLGSSSIRSTRMRALILLHRTTMGIDKKHPYFSGADQHFDAIAVATVATRFLRVQHASSRVSTYDFGRLGHADARRRALVFLCQQCPVP